MNSNEDKLSLIYNTATKLGRYFTDKKGTHYCFLYDGYTVLVVGSDKFIRKVMKYHHQYESQIIRKDDVKGILGHLINLSEKMVLDYNIAKRCAFYKDSIYLDLCNINEHTIIKISNNAIEEYESLDSPLLESRNNTLTLPRHDVNAKIDDLLSLIDKYFYIDDSKKLLLAVYIVSLFIEHIQTPILLLTGSKGSGKSMCLRFLKQLVDPTKDDLNIFPTNERDLSIMLNNSYMVAFDNVSDSTISNKASDMLCVAISGGIKSTRKLYSDDELAYMYLKNKISMTGIGTLVSKPDVLDRSLLVTMKRIPEIERKSSTKLEEQFERDIPTFLGSIYKILQATLSTADSIEVENISRLVDFCQYGYCIAEVIGKGNGQKFLEIYKDNINELNTTALNENPVAICIIKLMKDKKELELSVSDLYNKICIIAERDFINRRIKNFPGAPNVLSSRIEEIKSNLEEIGIGYDKKNIGKCKMITLTNVNYKK